jgi:NitT/TauT family transport system ATP-binding protein
MTHSDFFSEDARSTEAPTTGERGGDASHLETLPLIDIDEVIGICELVHGYGDCVDVHDLAREFGHARLMFLTVEGARMLGLVKLHHGELSLSALGRSWIQGDAQERQRVLHHQMATLKPIRWLCTQMRRAESGSASADELLGKVSLWVPIEEAPSKFWTLVNWGSYARLFDYEEDRKMLVLRSPDTLVKDHGDDRYPTYTR